MLAKFMGWLDKFDDEKFLVDVATSESRKEKILKLRRARSIQLLSIIFIASFVILLTSLYPTANQSPMLIMLGHVLLLLIIFAVSDLQIKMLLLFEKKQPKG